MWIDWVTKVESGDWSGGGGAMAGVRGSSVREFCDWETANATCPGRDELVVVRSARYGRLRLNRCAIKAKFHYTGPSGPDPTGPAGTRMDFVGDPHGPNGVSGRPGPQKSPCVSLRVRSGPCSGI